MTVINLEAAKLERSPHMTGPAQCLSCKHEWTAVAPVGTVALDYPACGGHKGQFEYLVDAPEGSAFFQCHYRRRSKGARQMLTEEQIIAIKKAAIADDPGKPWGDSIAFARAIESAVRAELVAESPLTEDQCNEFRRLPVSFNDMVRAIYEAGRASKADEYAHIRREARNAALEEAAKMCERRANSLRDGLNRKQIATKLSKDLWRTITENMISIAFMARGVNKNDWRK